MVEEKFILHKTSILMSFKFRGASTHPPFRPPAATCLILYAIILWSNIVLRCSWFVLQGCNDRWRFLYRPPASDIRIRLDHGGTPCFTRPRESTPEVTGECSGRNQVLWVSSVLYQSQNWLAKLCITLKTYWVNFRWFGQVLITIVLYISIVNDVSKFVDSCMLFKYKIIW